LGGDDFASRGFEALDGIAPPGRHGRKVIERMDAGNETDLRPDHEARWSMLQGIS
jgi:hypothetical protein